MGQIKFIGSAVMITLFAIAIIGFCINFAIDNDTRISLTDDEDFNTLKTSLSNDSQQLYVDMNTSSDAMYKSTISTQVDATEGGTSFKVGPLTALGMTYKVIKISYTKIFGADSSFAVFMTSLITLLGFISALYIWKVWKGGNPD